MLAAASDAVLVAWSMRLGAGAVGGADTPTRNKYLSALLFFCLRDGVEEFFLDERV